MKQDAQACLDERHRADVERAHRAVDRWTVFPVDRVPRPLVFIGATARVDGGFRSGAAKLAFLHGRVDAAVPLPDAVVRVLTDRPAAGSPATAAVDGSVTITGAALSQTEFRTDRGGRVLPAWRLESDAALGPIWVLAPDVWPRAWWPAWAPGPGFAAPSPGRGNAVAAPDGQTLTYSFVGGRPETMDYPGAALVESAHAVCVVPEPRRIGPLAGAEIAVGVARQVTVALSSPLGARVLVSLDATPMHVRPSTAGVEVDRGSPGPPPSPGGAAWAPARSPRTLA